MNPNDQIREAFEQFRDQRNKEIELQGHKPISMWHITNAHWPTWQAAQQAATVAVNEQDQRDAKRYRALMNALNRDQKDDPILTNTSPAGYNGSKYMWAEFGVKAPEWERPTSELFTEWLDAAIVEIENAKAQP